MEKVTGIGGLFFRSKDPEATAQWYEDKLGVAKVPTDENGKAWVQEAGTTAFSPFPMDTDYFSGACMVNFRVSDMDAMVKQLRSMGVEVAFDPQESPFGRFAKLKDLDGNPIELWEPGK